MKSRQLAILVAINMSAIVLPGCAGIREGHAVRGSSRYSHRLHDRFYEAWIPPRHLDAPRGKISVPVDVAVDRSGVVQSFEIARPSGYRAMDDSIRQVGRRMRRVAPPPSIAANGVFRLRVFFDLDVKL